LPLDVLLEMAGGVPGVRGTLSVPAVGVGGGPRTSRVRWTAGAPQFACPDTGDDVVADLQPLRLTLSTPRNLSGDLFIVSVRLVFHTSPAVVV
jgi:hypothetical protein